MDLESREKLLTKMHISFAVNVKLICAFVFPYAKYFFSHDEAHFIIITLHPLWIK